MRVTMLRLPTPDPDSDTVEALQGLTGTDWLQAGAIMLGAIAVAIAANRIARSIVSRSLGAGFGAIITARIIGYLIFLIGLVYALNTLGVRVGPLLGALGLSGLVLALALQKVVENFVGALILQTRRPFTVGDTVQLDGHTGVVTDVDARTVVLRGLDGSMIRLPNMDVLNSAIVNLTRDSARRSELQVGVAYDSDLEQATRVLGEAVARVPRIRTMPKPQVLLRQFGESSIDFTIFYWHTSDVPSELATTHDLMLAVHHALADEGITIAFPQMVVWPGHDATDNPYGSDPAEVFTGQPSEAPPPQPAEPTPRRWPWQRN
ncbi:MAG: mechanosensitive ion channel [Ilumatobacteraceae bacterium]|nr:mechanosensitive ion channel [Ilumatobacteraceae bacterium]